MNKAIKPWAIRIVSVARDNYRWLIVGLSTKVLDFLAFNVVYLINKNIFLANALSAILSVSYNYTMHHVYTYSGRANFSQSIGRYLVLIMMFFLLDLATITCLVSFGIVPAVAKFISMGLLAFASVLILNSWVFRDTKPRAI
jgi:putative flippase GtrA